MFRALDKLEHKISRFYYANLKLPSVMKEMLVTLSKPELTEDDCGKYMCDILKDIPISVFTVDELVSINSVEKYSDPILVYILRYIQLTSIRYKIENQLGVINAYS